jgi:hypothetical protein
MYKVLLVARQLGLTVNTMDIALYPPLWSLKLRRHWERPDAPVYIVTTCTNNKLVTNLSSVSQSQLLKIFKSKVWPFLGLGLRLCKGVG